MVRNDLIKMARSVFMPPLYRLIILPRRNESGSRHPRFPAIGSNKKGPLLGALMLYYR